ncbi:MAG: hypothetical protein ACRC62_06445 [Microcoleus sp.]
MIIDNDGRSTINCQLSTFINCQLSTFNFNSQPIASGDARTTTIDRLSTDREFPTLALQLSTINYQLSTIN